MKVSKLRAVEPVPDQETWALVPVKELARSKKRLAPCLGNRRHGIAGAMLRDLLHALNQCSSINRIAIVTADPEVSSTAASGKVLIVNEQASGDLNQAISQGVRAIGEAGGQRVAIIPADVPLATGGEIDRLVESLQAAERDCAGPAVGICPCLDMDGTNFLYIPTAGDFPFAYGTGSYQRHLAAAAEFIGKVVTLSSPALALDIDQQKDLDEFVSRCRQDTRLQETETWKFLCDIGYIEQLPSVNRMQK